MTLILPSPAKLNLCLHIVNQRPDGYHNLQTVFQFINLCDELSFEITDDSRIKLVDALPNVPKADNLIYRSAKLLQQHSQCKLGARISLHKHIPMGGGLGGGSSNAATTLLALNQLWQTDLNTEQLMALGLKLGADVPVFIGGKAAWGEGVGEKLTAIDLPENWYLVLHPDCHVDTAKVFKHKDLTRNSPPITIAAFLAEGGHNDCENVVRLNYPKVDSALKLLNKFGNARMTGTGACVFCTFESESEACAAQAEISKASEIKSFVVKGLNVSPLSTALKQTGATIHRI
ncbi:MAG TPA: 4-(cytidine 5'-diphospho)-2-C-methyl-D-erythritol kinase [Pseudomonadales bacterium]